MPDLPITGLAAVVTPSRGLILPCVDTVDDTMAPTGTDKQLTAAQLLSTMVAADLPIWDDTNSTLLLAPTGDPSPCAAGDVWVSSATGGLAVGRAPGLVVRAGGPIFSCGAGTAIANSTAATSVFAGTTAHFGSLTIPANTLRPGSTIALTMLGKITTAPTGPAVTVRALLGGTTVLVGTNSGLGGGFSGAALFDGFIIKVLSVGTSGSCEGVFQIAHISSTNVNAFGVIGYTPTLGTPATINTTGALTFDLQYQFGVASASNTFQLLDATLSLF